MFAWGDCILLQRSRYAPILSLSVPLRRIFLYWVEVFLWGSCIILRGNRRLECSVYALSWWMCIFLFGNNYKESATGVAETVVDPPPGMSVSLDTRVIFFLTSVDAKSETVVESLGASRRRNYLWYVGYDELSWSGDDELIDTTELTSRSRMYDTDSLMRVFARDKCWTWSARICQLWVSYTLSDISLM